MVGARQPPLPCVELAYKPPADAFRRCHKTASWHFRNSVQPHNMLRHALTAPCLPALCPCLYAGTLPSWPDYPATMMYVSPQRELQFCGEIPAAPLYMRYAKKTKEWVPLTSIPGC